jgi:hypothetical protein
MRGGWSGLIRAIDHIFHLHIFYLISQPCASPIPSFNNLKRISRAANYCQTSDNVRLNLANVRAKVILIGHWSDHIKKLSHTFFCCDKIQLLWNSLNLHFAIKFTRSSRIYFHLTLRQNGIHTCLVTYNLYLLWHIYVFCPTHFKLCPTKIKSDRTNVLSSQIFICSPEYPWPDVSITYVRTEFV